MRFYKIEILFTFDVQYPINSTSIKSTTIIVLTYLKKYENNINLDMWDRAIINFVNIEQQDLNRFLLHYIAYYKDSKYNDIML